MVTPFTPRTPRPGYALPAGPVCPARIGGEAMSPGDVVRWLSVLLAIGLAGQAISLAVEYVPQWWARWDAGRWFR